MLVRLDGKALHLHEGLSGGPATSCGLLMEDAAIASCKQKQAVASTGVGNMRAPRANYSDKMDYDYLDANLPNGRRLLD
jgi:hypothetical protein